MNGLYTSTSNSSPRKLRLAFIALLVNLGVTPKAIALPQATSTSNQSDKSNSSPAQKDESKQKKDESREASAENTLGFQTIKNIVRDQRQIWTSPAHVRLGHADWL